MTGGCEVRTEWQARDASRLFARTVQVGDMLREEPCLPRAHLKVLQEKTGRPCPRVDLPAELADAGQLALLLFHGSPAAVPFMLSRPARRRRRLYDRASTALSAPAVATFLRAKREAEAAARNAQRPPG